MEGLYNIIFIAILIFISLTDQKKHQIPDNIVILLSGVVLISLFYFDNLTFMERITGMICVSGLLTVLDILCPGAFGGGDIKLTAVMGFACGMQKMNRIFLITVLAAVIIYWLKKAVNKISRIDKIAMAPYLCAGFIIATIFEKL